MEQETVKIGVGLARKALRFAIFFNNVTSGECREAVKTLFGEEVDAVLANDFVPKYADGMTAAGDKYFNRQWDAANNRESWGCKKCGQTNSYYATTCGRCGDT